MMTRINCVPVTELIQKQLVAEYREICRARSWKIKDRPLPDSYRMGQGHCLFFHNKGRYLEKRHKELIAEMKRRNYSPTLPPLDLSHWPAWAMNDWEPNKVDMAINRARIAERIADMEAKKAIKDSSVMTWQDEGQVIDKIADDVYAEYFREAKEVN